MPTPLFRLLSWNIRQGGGTRVPAIVEAISKYDAHVLVISEYRHNKRGADLAKRVLFFSFRRTSR